MRGNIPMPAKIKKNTDHRISKDLLNAREKLEEKLKSKSFLHCPSTLSAIAKKEWRRLMKLYKNMEVDILSDLDKSALMIYCEAYAIYTKAHQEWIIMDKIVSSDDDRQKFVDKVFSIMEKQSQIMSRFSEQLCLTPVGRARMGMSVKIGPSPLEKMLMEDDE